MDLFETTRIRIWRRLRLYLPLLFTILICLLFVSAVGRTSAGSLERERDTLEQALRDGAVRTYALTGRYPESLDALTESFHITYDREKFVVEYIPNGSNLLPQITVLLLQGRGGGGS